MEESKWVFIVLIVISILFWRDHNNLINQVESLQDQISNFDYRSRLCFDALDQANLNIEDAKSYAWESYDDMGDALDNLETVEP